MSDNQSPMRHSNQSIDEDNLLLLGKNMNIDGDLLGEGTLIISGKVEGNVSAKKIISEAGSSIVGNIESVQLDVSGSVKGLIQATNVIIRKGAFVDGEVRYISLAMEQGCEVIGKLKKVMEKPSAHTRPPEKFTTKDEVLHLTFPSEVRFKLEDLVDRTDVNITLRDGKAAPSWINLTNDRLNLLVSKHAIQELKNKNESIELRINIGDNFYNFSLPG